MPHPGWSGVSFTGIGTKREISTPEPLTPAARRDVLGVVHRRRGKGQLVDLVAGTVNSSGVIEYLIDGSGAMLHAGFDPLEVALEHPYDPTQAIGVVTIDGAALCAANRRAWGDGLHHVLDGVTGRSVQTVVATWTMAATAMKADALATALFLVDPAVLAKDFNVDSLQVFSDGSAAFSTGFRGSLFI